MNDIREDLKAYLDGELPEARAAEVAAAIESDPALQQEIMFMKQLSSELKSVATVDPAIAGAQETLDKLRRPRRKPFFTVIRENPLLAGSFALILIAGPFLIKGIQEGSSEDMAAAAVVTKSSGFENSAGIASPNEEGFGSFRGSPTVGDTGTASEVDSGLSEDRARRVIAGKEAYRQPEKSTKSSMGMGGADPSLPTSQPTTAEAHLYARPAILRTADISVGVKDARESMEAVSKMVEGRSGFVLNTNLSSTESETRANISLKVPEVAFEGTMRELRALGQVVNEHTSGQDVTAELVDARTRKEILADEEANLIARLRASKNSTEKYQLRAELRDVRMQLESWKAQEKDLKDQTTYSSMNVTLIQRDGGTFGATNWSENSYSNATSGLKTVGRFFGQLAIYGLVYAPVWLPLAFIGWLMARKSRVV